MYRNFECDCCKTQKNVTANCTTIELQKCEFWLCEDCSKLLGADDTEKQLIEKLQVNFPELIK